MGNERFKIIKVFEHREWLKDAPVKVEKSQLLFDTKKDQTILQIKLFNLSDSIIRSVYLNINCFDDAMDYIMSLVDITYLSVDAKPQSNFGDRQPVILKSSQVANVEIIISKVVFTDDTVWRNEDKNIGLLLPEQLQINTQDNLYEQIIREFDGMSVRPCYWIESNEEYWRCTCGQANSLTVIKCGYCGIEKKWLNKHLNKDYLFEENRKYQEAKLLREKKEAEDKIKKDEEEKAAKADKERRDQEEKKRKEELRIKNVLKKKRFIKRTILIFGFSVISILAFIIYKKILTPHISYSNAMQLFEEKRFEEASEVFYKLIGYKDSDIMYLDSEYGYAEQLYGNENYENAIKKFKALGDYKNSEDMYIDSWYGYAKQFYDSEQYENAIKEFMELDDYKDSEDMVIKSIYNYGKLLLSSGDYSSALIKFSEVKTYADTENYISECHYKMGIELCKDKSWEEAIKEFTIIKNYKDSYYQIQKCHFQIAYNFMSNEEWNSAIDEYKKIDANAIDEDISVAISEAYYQSGLSNADNLSWDEAVNCMNMAITNGDYKNAKSLIVDYNDTIKNNKLASDYNEAVKLEKGGRLDLAYNIYKELPDDYEDCSKRINNIKKYVSYCGEYEGVAKYFKKTKEDTDISGDRPLVTITFEDGEPIINVSFKTYNGYDDYKGKLKDMPITDVYGAPPFEMKTVIRYSSGKLYRDWYIDDDDTDPLNIWVYKKR